MRFALRGPAVAAALIACATHARAEEMLFPPATPSCYVGTEVTPIAASAAPYAKPPVPVSTVRLERGFVQLKQEETREQKPGERQIYLRVLVTFADAAKTAAAKRYSSGAWELMSCTAELCDANNYKVERQSDGTVLLRMTGGMNVGGGAHQAMASRRLPDGHVYKLEPKELSACR